MLPRYDATGIRDLNSICSTNRGIFSSFKFDIDTSCAHLIYQIFVYCIVILFNLFLRNLLIATIVMEFRLRTLPQKYLKRRRLLRPRIIQRKRKGNIADKPDEDRTDVPKTVMSTVVKSKQGNELPLTNDSPSVPDNSLSLTSHPQSSLFLDTSNAGFREQNAPQRRTSPGLDTPLAVGHNGADVNHRFDTLDVGQAQVGRANSHSPKQRMYAIKRYLKILRRKIEIISTSLKGQAGMVRENFRAYMQRVYYRSLHKQIISYEFNIFQNKIIILISGSLTASFSALQCR